MNEFRNKIFTTLISLVISFPVFTDDLKIADDFQRSILEEIKLLVPGETKENDSVKLIKSFGKRSKKSETTQTIDLAPKSSSKNKLNQILNKYPYFPYILGISILTILVIDLVNYYK